MTQKQFVRNTMSAIQAQTATSLHSTLRQRTSTAGSSQSDVATPDAASQSVFSLDANNSRTSMDRWREGISTRVKRSGSIASQSSNPMDTIKRRGSFSERPALPDLSPSTTRTASQTSPIKGQRQFDVEMEALLRVCCSRVGLHLSLTWCMSGYVCNNQSAADLPAHDFRFGNSARQQTVYA